MHERGKLEEVDRAVAILVPRGKDRLDLIGARGEPQPAERGEELRAVESAVGVGVKRVEDGDVAREYGRLVQLDAS